MNDLCADIGYRSINHVGEQLCGDHVDVVEQGENSMVIVLADGLGSGVKASILSTLTSKIISTMMAEGLGLEDCVSTIAATLPVCSVRGVAYSTFSILHLIDNETAEIIQYDNPMAILIRNEVNYDYPKTEMTIGGKKIYKSVIKLQEGDIFILMSDGCPHAGIGTAYNFGWKREDIITYMEAQAPAGYTAKTLSTILVDECDRLYDHKPGDDTTACVVRIRQAGSHEPALRPALQPGRQRPYDVPVLLQGGQAHRLRRNHIHHRGQVPAQAPENDTEVRGLRRTAHCGNRRRRSGY